MRFVIKFALFSSALSKMTGTAKCPNSDGIKGYSDLFTLQRDIAIASNKTNFSNGGSYVLCPNTEFDFSVKVPSFDDDIFQIPTSNSELDPILIEASNTKIICGNDGNNDDACILRKGSFHILIVGAAKKVTITGLTFREAKNTSILYSGRGGEVTFNNCKWDKNRGNAAILAVGEISVLSKPTQRPVSKISFQPSSSEPTLLLTASQRPSIRTKPSLSPYPKNPSISPRPSRISEEPVTPIPSPTISDMPFPLAPNKVNITSSSSVFPSFINGNISTASLAPSLANDTVVTSSPYPTSQSGIDLPTFQGSNSTNSSAPTFGSNSTLTISPAPTVLSSTDGTYSFSPFPSNLPSPSLSLPPTDQNVSLIPTISVPISPNGTAPMMGSLVPSPSLVPFGSTIVPTSPIPDDDLFVFPDQLKALKFDDTYPFHKRKLQKEPSFYITCERCIFVANEVDLAVVFVLRGQVILLNNEFTSNIIEGAIVSVFDGTLKADSSLFLNNKFSVFPSPIFLDYKSKLVSSSKNCGSNNEGGNCNSGIFLQKKAGDCSNSKDCIGSCNEFNSKACQKQSCFKKWKNLREAIQSATDSKQGGMFQVCEKSVLRVDKKIIIDQSQIEIICGKQGLRSSNCVIVGGSIQIEILGEASDILISGLTFTTSSNTAIKASGRVSANLALIDCEFSEHTGRSVIEIYNGGLDEKVVDLERIKVPPEQSMTVIAVNCSIIDNSLLFAPVSNFNGVTFFDRSLFQNNKGKVGGLLALFDAQVSLSNNCFIDQVSSSLPGYVFLQKNSLALRNLNNFESKSGETSSNKRICNDLFLESKGNCLVDSKSCQGNCKQFSSKKCKAKDYIPTETPSISPSGVPTTLETQTSAIPTILPTASPSDSITSSSIPTILDTSASPSGSMFPSSPPTIFATTFPTESDKSIPPSGSIMPSSLPTIEDKSISPSGSRVPSNVPTIQGISNESLAPSDSTFSSSLPTLLYTSIIPSGSAIPSSLPTDLGVSLSPSDTEMRSSTPTTLDNSKSPSGSTLPSGLPTVSFISTIPSRTTIPSSYPTNFDSIIPTVESAIPSITDTIRDNSISESPSQATCFRHWDDLSRAVNESLKQGSGGEFIICSNSEMNLDMFMDDKITPIVIASDNILLKCGETGELKNKCIIYGGKVQFQIEGSAKGIEFSGIHFMGALKTSINAFGDAKSDVRFKDCSWENGLGSQVLHINGKLISDPKDTTSGASTRVVPLSTRSSMSIHLVDCLFTSNTASASVIVNVGGLLTLERNIFAANEASNAVVSVLEGGTAEILENCFLNNAVEKGLGVIIFYQTSSLTIAQGNFGRSNTVGKKDTCNEILIVGSGKADDSQCIPFDADDCPIYDLPPTNHPSFEPSFTPTSVPDKEATRSPTKIAKKCFDNWKELSSAIMNSITQNNFIICPETTLDVDTYPEDDVSPIIVSSNKTSIVCGEDGGKSNACIISGGVNHFLIVGNVRDIKIIGITFENCRGISVHAGAAEYSSVHFLNCEWRNNEGSSAILMLDAQKDGSAMNVHISDCNFTNNDFADAAIVNIGGMLAVEDSLFFKNQASDGAISVMKGGDVSLKYSCFVQNEKGAVNLNGNSQIVKNEGNFAIANDYCNGVLDKDDKYGILCGDACAKFGSKLCYVQDFDKRSFPTSSPSDTLQPICVPIKSKSPSVGNKQIESGLPSFEPSSPTYFSPQPSRNPANMSNHPTVTEIPSQSTEIETASPSLKSEPTFISQSRSQIPSVISIHTKIPSSMVYPSVKPSRLRISTSSPSVASVPVVSPESFLPTPDPAQNSLFPTEMSLSMYYNFFYHYN
jgi:hypothetical protein